MALLKKIQYSNGTETNYHKIGEIRVIPLANRITYVEKWPEGYEPPVPEESEVVTPEIPEDVLLVEEGEKGEEIVPEIIEVVEKPVSIMVQILSYVSQEIREASVDNSLTSQINYFTILMEDLVATDIMTLCYNLIKTLPAFVDAEDI